MNSIFWVVALLLAETEKPSAFRKHAEEERARQRARAARIQSSQANATKAPNPSKLKAAPSGGEEGLAFILSADMDGRPTATGELFDSTALNASHRSYPLRSQLRVTNLENGKVLVVRVNDRGGFSGNRILGLTPKAAEELGFGKAGMQRVRIEPVTGTSR